MVSKEKLIHLKLCLKKGFAVHRRLTVISGGETTVYLKRPNTWCIPIIVYNIMAYLIMKDQSTNHNNITIAMKERRKRQANP